jgi:hypothetical protein
MYNKYIVITYIVINNNKEFIFNNKVIKHFLYNYSYIFVKMNIIKYNKLE